MSDVKLLFGWAAGLCAFPGCTTGCLRDPTEADGPAVIGKIAHIVAHGDKGPRADPTLPIEKRDCYENWILLCPTHHDIVDGQPNGHTVADLRKWKASHERWVRERTARAMPGVTFAELEVVTAALMGSPAREPTSNFKVMNPAEKMAKNRLSDAVHWNLTLGLAKANEVAAYVEHVAARDSKFPERLAARFVAEYQRLRGEELAGDALFESLVQFSAGGSRDFPRVAAGVAVLAYLFEKCEVFES
jgi:hypothetical protein